MSDQRSRDGNGSSGEVQGNLRPAPCHMQEADQGQDRLASVLLALVPGRAGAGSTGQPNW